MGMFTKIPESTFQDLQLDAGVLLKTFDPDDVSAPADSDIICATTGGITVSCVPEFEDFFADVDNAPNNVKEGKKLTGWTCTLSTTSLGTSPELIRLALGAADVSGDSVVPRRDLDQDDDFADLWWVGDKADGGMVAVQILNALSTGGFVLTTTKNGKGTIGLELTGHVSIEDQDTIPMAFYSTSGSAPTSYTYTVATNTTGKNPANEGWYVLDGNRYVLSTDTSVDSNKTYYVRSASI